MKTSKKRLLILLAFAGLFACAQKPEEVTKNLHELNGSVKLAILAVENVASVEVTISGGALSAPIVSTVSRTQGTAYYQALFENIPASLHYTVSVRAEAFAAGNPTAIVYLGSKEELTVVAGQTTSVTIFLQKQGIVDLTAPVITSVTFVSDSGNTFFYQSESGTFTIATRFADRFTWTALNGVFTTNSLQSVRFTAGAVSGTDTVTAMVENSENGKTAFRSIPVQVLSPDGTLDVTVFFAPEITDVSASPPTFSNVAGELVIMTATTDPDLLSSPAYRFVWSSTCDGISVTSGTSSAVFAFEFTGSNLSPVDCLVTATLQEQDSSSNLVGFPFSQVVYRLAYVAP